MHRELTQKKNQRRRAWCWTASAALAALAAAGLPAAMATAATQAGNQAALPRGASGTAYSWGNNATGELGQGGTTNSLAPKRVAKLASNVEQMSAGTDGSLALTGDGAVWSWGGNDQGQLGTGNQTDSSTPVPVKRSSGFGQLTGIRQVVS